MLVRNELGNVYYEVNTTRELNAKLEEGYILVEPQEPETKVEKPKVEEPKKENKEKPKNTRTRNGAEK